MSEEPEPIKRRVSRVEKAIDVRERINRERRILRQIHERAVLSTVRREK